MRSIREIMVRPGERGIIVGTVGSGKSTLLEQLIFAFLDDAKNHKVLIVDTKPRFMGTRDPYGMRIRGYRGQDWGEKIDACVLDRHARDGGLRLAEDQGERLFIAQSPADEDADVRWMQMIMREWYKRSKKSQPRLLVVDETMDFYSVQGQPVLGTADMIMRSARSGRERGLGVIVGSQVPVSIPKIYVREATKSYTFKLDAEDTVKRLTENGMYTPAPKRRREFYYFDRFASSSARLFTLSL